MDGYSGLKYLVDENGTTQPTHEYVCWLEDHVKSLSEQLTAARATLSDLRARALSSREKQKRHWSLMQDYMPYSDDDRDR